MRRVQAPGIQACRGRGPKPEGPHEKGSSQTVTGRGGQLTLSEERNAPSSLFHCRKASTWWWGRLYNPQILRRDWSSILPPSICSISPTGGANYQQGACLGL